MTIQQLVEETRTVYSLPLFYERLNEAINHPRSSIDDISRIITEDQGLTARILKLANSPLFGCYSRVDSITKAVTIIGTQQLRDLALASSVITVFQGVPEELLCMASFWQHSIACGIVARNLATFLHESNVERFFVGGILHDVGQLIICTVMHDTFGAVLERCRQDDRIYHHAERDILGFDHADVGGAIFSAWKIPASIIEPVRYHHNPGQATQFPLQSAAIHLADIICQGMQFGHGAEWAVPPLDENAWERLGLPVSFLGRVIRQSLPQIRDAYTILTETP